MNNNKLTGLNWELKKQTKNKQKKLSHVPPPLITRKKKKTSTSF